MNSKDLKIGDSYLRMKNTENISSLYIYKLDDVYELSLIENGYAFEIIRYADDVINYNFSEN